MNSQPADNSSGVDAELRCLIREAGEIEVTPRQEHVEAVKQMLVKRTAMPTTPRRAWTRLLWPMVAAAAALLMIAVLLRVGVHSAWADVQDAIRSQSWA